MDGDETVMRQTWYFVALPTNSNETPEVALKLLMVLVYSFAVGFLL